jgi:hypothetical protein
MAFQGIGGGHSSSTLIIAELKKQNVPVGVWFFDQQVIEKLEAGRVLWHEVRDKGVPLLSVISQEYSLAEIQSQVEDILR